MQAQSLLGSARTIDARLEDLLSVNLLAGSSVAWTHAAVIRETLGDVAEQLRASAPFPATGDSARTGDAVRTDDSSRTGDSVRTDDSSRTGDSTGEDEAFFDLLDALAANESATPERVAQFLDGGQQTLDRLRDAGRVGVRASTLVIPLDGESSGRNWWAVLEYLCESVDRLAAKASRLQSRVVVDGADSLLVTAWDSIAERLDVLRDVLDETIANGRYAGRSATVGEEPTEFVAWTADQFRSEE